MTDDVEVRFGADIAPLEAGSKGAQTAVLSLRGAVTQLATGFKEAGAQAVTSMRAAAEGATRTAEAITAAREMVVGFGEAMLAAFAVDAVVEWARHMGEAGEAVEHMSQRLGMGIGDVQALGAMATLSGANLDQLGNAVGRLDKAFALAKEGSKQQALAFRELGIDTEKTYTNLQLLRTVSEKLSNMDNGPAKDAIAMQLLGRSGAALIPLFNMLGQNWDAMSAIIEKYGIKNKDAAEKAAQLGESFNENRVAMQGLGNVFAQSMAPALEATVRGVNDLVAGFVKSYQQGGAAKQVMDFLTGAYKVLADTVGYLGLIIDYTWKTIDGAAWMGAGVIQAVLDAIVGYIKTDIDAWKALGNVIGDVFTLNWGAIQGDIRAGLTKLSDDVVNASRKMGQDAAAGWKKGANEWLSADKDASAFSAWEKNMWADSGPHGPKIKDSKQGDTSGLQSGNNGAKKEDELARLKTLFDEREAAHHGMIADMTADELAFWQQVQSGAIQANLSATQANEVAGNIAKLSHREELAALAQEIQDHKAAAQDAIKGFESVAAAHKKALDEQIKDVEDAEKRGVLSHASAAAQVQALVAKEVQDAKVAANAELSARLAADSFIMAHSAVTTSEYQSALRDRTQAMQAHADAVVKIDADANDKIKTHTRTTTDEVLTFWQGMIDPIVNAWGSGLRGMLTGTESWRQALGNIGLSILDDFIGVIEKQVSKWLVGEAMKTGLTSVGAAARSAIEVGAAAKNIALKGAEVAFHGAAELAKTVATAAGAAARFAVELAAHIQSLALIAIRAVIEIGAAAARAAAGAFAAVAAIPIIGPALAPAAAAGALAAVLEFGHLVASAAGGWGDVPSDGFPTLLHKREMVLPASIASPLRSMISSGGAPAQAASDGASNPSFAISIHAIDTQSGTQFLQRNVSAIADALRQAWRNGAPLTA